MIVGGASNVQHCHATLPAQRGTAPLVSSVPPLLTIISGIARSSAHRALRTGALPIRERSFLGRSLPACASFLAKEKSAFTSPSLARLAILNLAHRIQRRVVFPFLIVDTI
jgi:hypothetical protein